MSPTDRPTRLTHPIRPTRPAARPIALVACLLVAVLAAACSSVAKVPPSAATPSQAATSGPSSATATATPRSASWPTAGDATLVIGRAGQDDLEVVLASTGERFFRIPWGAPDAGWTGLINATVSAAATVVRDVTVPELDSTSQIVEGAWRLPTLGADPTPVGVSQDGKTIVLVEDRAKPASGAGATTRFAILHRPLSDKTRIVTLQGSFEYDTLSPDGHVLYVVEHLSGPPEGHYQVRAVDVATGTLRPEVVVDKSGLDEAMAGYPIAQARRPDGMVFTLYRGPEHPFIHALSSVDAWALCIDLPATGADDAAAALDWGLAASIDGRSLIVANATLGLAVQIPFGDLAVRKSVTFAPSASTGISLAKFGHDAGGPVDRRLVMSPVGSALYAAGSGGIVRLDAGDFSMTGRFLEGSAVDAIAVTPDGATLFALLHAGGRIVRVDTATGKLEGAVPGDGFDRLVAVVPW